MPSTISKYQPRSLEALHNHQHDAEATIDPSLFVGRERQERRRLEHFMLHSQRLKRKVCLHYASAESGAGFAGTWLEMLMPTKSATHRELQIALKEACAEASEDNWDGYGARAVRSDLREEAERLIRSLPAIANMPEVSVDPEGAVQFDWQASSDRMLSVNVDGGGMLAYAGVIGRNKFHGVVEFKDKIPKILLDVVELL